MSESKKWSTYEMTKEPQGAGPEAEVKYAIPYNWGAFHVTDRAHESYGFVPLAADKVAESEIDIREPKLGLGRLDVYLLDPAEFRNRVEVENNPQSAQLKESLEKHSAGIIVLGRPNLYKGGVEVCLGLNKTIEEVKSDQFEVLERSADELGVELDDMVTDRGISAAEVIDQETTQEMIHALSGIAGDSTVSGYGEFLEIQYNKYILKRLSPNGAGMMGSLAFLGAVGIENQIIETSMILGVAGGYLGISWRELKLYFQDANKRAKENSENAHRLGQLVTNNIHDSYCVHNFDQQNEHMFGQGDD